MNGYRSAEAAQAVIVLCHDQRLGRGLCAAASDRGLHPVWLSPDSLTTYGASAGADDVSRLMDEHRAVLLFGDADDCPVLRALPAGFPAVVWTRDEAVIPPVLTPPVLLHRPLDCVLTDRAVTACLSASDAPVSSGNPAPKPSAGDAPAAVSLTPNERRILDCLTSRRGDTVTREELRALIGEAPDGPGNMVDVYISRLRAKLEKPAGIRMIASVRGAGYRLL